MLQLPKNTCDSVEHSELSTGTFVHKVNHNTKPTQDTILFPVLGNKPLRQSMSKVVQLVEQILHKSNHST